MLHGSSSQFPTWHLHEVASFASATFSVLLFFFKNKKIQMNYINTNFISTPLKPNGKLVSILTTEVQKKGLVQTVPSHFLRISIIRNSFSCLLIIEQIPSLHYSFWADGGQNHTHSIKAFSLVQRQTLLKSNIRFVIVHDRTSASSSLPLPTRGRGRGKGKGKGKGK